MFAGRKRPQKIGSLVNASAALVQPDPVSTFSKISTTPSAFVEVEIDVELPKEVSDTMNVVRLTWDFMTNFDFNPIPYSLSLLDGSSLGNDFESFCEVYDMLESAMDVVVNDNHQAFNIAIQRFSTVVDTIKDSQKKVDEMKIKLGQTKEFLSCKRFDFLHIWVKSLQFKEMSKVLDSIVYLQSTKIKLEGLIEERHFLHALRVLLAAEKVIYSTDLMQIKALREMRDGFAKIKEKLQDTLTSELSNHIYLKNRSAQNRVGHEIPDISSLRSDLQVGSPASDMMRFAKSAPVYEEVDLDNGNLQVDSYSHIQVLLEGLYHLEKLEYALGFLKDRIGIEMYHVVDRILTELELVNKKIEETDTGSEDHLIFADFLTKLYERLDAVLDGHIFCLEVSQKLFEHMADTRPALAPDPDLIDIVAAEDTGYRTLEVYTKRDVAVAIQNEVKALLYDYLTVSDQLVKTGVPVSAIAEMFKDRRKGSKRPQKQVFHVKLGAEDVVKKAFQESCPMFGDGQVVEPMREFKDHEVGHANRFETVIESGHRQIVVSNPSNILIAYTPTLVFMNQMEKKLSTRLANFKMFLEDFVVNVYLPQVQEQVLVYFHANVNGTDAFQADLYPTAPFPLIKSGLCIVLEIHGICKTIRSVPVHAMEMVKFVELTMKRFYEKCCGQFKGLLRAEEGGHANGEDDNKEVISTNILSVQWAVHPELVGLFLKNSYIGSRQIDLVSNQTLLERETALEIGLKGDRSFDRGEMILDSRNIQKLAHLMYGMEWVVDQIKHLRNPESLSERAPLPMSHMKSHSSLSDDSVFEFKFNSDGEMNLPLYGEMDESFDRMSRDLCSLIQLILFSLRIEIRCHVIFYLELSIREGEYFRDDEDFGPNPYITFLNSDLTLIEEIVSTTLPPRTARFLFEGITQLMSSVLISNVKVIRQINPYGVKKLTINVLCLQQNLVSFSALLEDGLEKCKLYISLLSLDGPKIMIFLENHPGLFTYDEYMTVMRLVYSKSSGKDNLEREKTLTSLMDYFVNHRA